jgi:hypothetical protein
MARLDRDRAFEAAVCAYNMETRSAAATGDHVRNATARLMTTGQALSLRLL